MDSLRRLPRGSAVLLDAIAKSSAIASEPPPGVQWAPCGECKGEVTGLRANALGTVHFAEPCGHVYANATGPVGTKEERLAACGPHFTHVPLSLVVEFRSPECVLCKDGLVDGVVMVKVPTGKRRRGQPKKVPQKAKIACRCAVARIQKAIHRISSTR